MRIRIQFLFDPDPDLETHEKSIGFSAQPSYTIVFQHVHEVSPNFYRNFLYEMGQDFLDIL